MGKDELSRLLASKRILPSALVWNPSMSGWEPLSTVPELKDIVRAIPPPTSSKPPPPAAPPPPPPQPAASAPRFVGPDGRVFVGPHATTLAAAQEALATLAIHETNAQQSGQHEAVTQWRSYSTYLSGLVSQLQMPGAPPMVSEQLKAGIAQVPPRNLARL